MKKHISLMASVFFLLIFSAASFFFLPPGSEAAVYRKSSSVMGTALEVTLLAASEEEANRAFYGVELVMKRLESVMSEWLETSPVSEVNRAAGKKPVKVPPEVFNVISAALRVSELSGGAFDLTWAAMRGLWDFRPGRERAPTTEEVRVKLGLVDYRDVELDAAASTVFLKRVGMAIGLGGIAKGYAVDKAMEAVIKTGVTDAIIKAGGDIRVQGCSENGLAWEVGIQDPRDKTRLMAKLKLSNASISTSGDYERFFIKDGHLYHHIIDPRTGFPARGARSVTIIGPDTMTTDALSTAVFVLGPDKGMELVEKLTGVEAIIVGSDGAVTSSGGVELGR